MRGRRNEKRMKKRVRNYSSIYSVREEKKRRE
jgi:hypothetical protein